jgi:hypothetical protein
MRTNNRDQDEPEFSILAWEAMLFSAGIVKENERGPARTSGSIPAVPPESIHLKRAGRIRF